MDDHFLPTTRHLYLFYKTLAEKALDQVDDAALHRCEDVECNSIAVVMQHMAGNMISRWTEFLSSDGEKPWRNRDAEFVDTEASREQLMAYWNKGWAVCFGALDALTATDLQRTIVIRQEPHTVIDAVLRQLAHYSYHVGQIVDLCRRYRKGTWTSLSIPRGGSAAFNKSAGTFLSPEGDSQNS